MQTEQFHNPYSTLVLYTNRTSSREQEMIRLNFNEQQIVPILLLNQLHLCSKAEQSIFQRNVLIVQIIWLLFQMSLYPIIEEQTFILEIFYYNSEYQPFYYVVLLIWVGSFLLLCFSDSIRQKPIYANIFTSIGVVFYSIFIAIQYYNNKIILQLEYLLLSVLAIQIIYLQIGCIKFTLLNTIMIGSFPCLVYIIYSFTDTMMVIVQYLFVGISVMIYNTWAQLSMEWVKEGKFHLSKDQFIFGAILVYINTLMPFC